MNKTIRFCCPVCNCTSFEAIHIERPGRESYRLPLFACCGCSLVFTDPARITLRDPGAYQSVTRPRAVSETAKPAELQRLPPGAVNPPNSGIWSAGSPSEKSATARRDSLMPQESTLGHSGPCPELERAAMTPTELLAALQSAAAAGDAEAARMLPVVTGWLQPERSLHG